MPHVAPGLVALFAQPLHEAVEQERVILARAAQQDRDDRLRLRPRRKTRSCKQRCCNGIE
jgi:hypothetical protein